MASIQDRSEFNSWVQELKEDALTPDQLAVLQAMVDDGDAESLSAAAQLLDWQETVIDPIEHYYGL